MDLQREVDVLAAFDHPAIPKAYGWVQSEAGAYLVMDYIPGPSLLQVLEQREGFLPEQEIIAWGIQACEVLDYLHTRQPDPWLFRDIKPSNMILDEQGGFHLVDFGTGVTYTPGRCYECIGTEGYAAPEQYQGGEEPRSDLYALGATLHQLATRIDPREETRRHPFTFAPPRSINPALSKEFAGVIQKALSYELEDRCSSAAEMESALKACS
jgi:serine/threonine protein kinase